MKTMIKFNPQLAMLAWRGPDENGVSYELYTKCGFKVTPISCTLSGSHSFQGLVRPMWSPDSQVTEFWTADGYYFGWAVPIHLDLQLFKITA